MVTPKGSMSTEGETL